MGEGKNGRLRLDFYGHLRLEFRGAKVTTDTGFAGEKGAERAAGADGVPRFTVDEVHNYICG